MAMTETDSPPPQDRGDRPGRRRPFSTLMKKLANFKGVSSGEGSSRQANSKRAHIKMSSKKRPSKNNNPYPQSGRIGNGGPLHQSESHYTFSTARSTRTYSASSVEHDGSSAASLDGHAPTTAGARSVAATVSTDHDATQSMMAHSHGASSVAGTSRTANGGMESRRGADSTFSSPAPSVRSLTTTLTTIQSLAPNGGGMAAANASTNQAHHQASSSQVIHFNQPFPTTSPASAIPAHLTPSQSTTGHPTTYSTATANNLLTDNASILTLASSSKRRRRRSFDTDASVRALAPSSLFGGSRESLPLSVLSANIEGGGPTTPGLQHTSSRIGVSTANGERGSIYSATGILAAASERNSFYAKQSIAGGAAGDGASVRSGLLGHGRADSVTGSIGGLTSPLASPRERDTSGVEEKYEEEEEEDAAEGEDAPTRSE